MDFVSFVMVAFSRARAITAMKELKVLETNQQKIGGGNTVTPNIIYHDVLLPIILLINASMHYYYCKGTEFLW